MAKLSGSERIIAFGITNSWVQAATMGAGDRAVVENFDLTKNAEMLPEPTIGGGAFMSGSNSQEGVTNPKLSFQGHLNFADSKLKAIAQFFGGCSLTNMASGEYSQSFMFEATQGAFYLTAAEQFASGSVREAPCAAVQTVTLQSTSFPGPIQLVIDALASHRKTTSTTNTTATLATTTVSNELRVIADPDDSFKLNAQAGAALAASDVKSITGFTITFSKPQELGHELRGIAGNGQPSLTGNPPLKVTLQVTFKNAEDATYFTAEDNGTAYKASFTFTGGTIATAAPYNFCVWFPYLKVLSEPTNPSANAADNPLTVTFEALQADSDPTGMLDTYPYITLQSDYGTAYLTSEIA